MTKAEEIVDRLLEYIWKNPGFGEERWVEFRKLIVKAIEQAVAEAKLEECRYWANCESDDYYEKGFLDGIAEQKEKDAMICLDLWKNADNKAPDFKQSRISHGCLESAKAIRES